MKEKRILNLFGQISDQYIEEAEITHSEKRKKCRSRRVVWSSVTAAVLAVAILCTVLLFPGRGGTNAYALALPDYPEMVPYSAEDSGGWWMSRKAQLEQPEGYADGLEAFYAASVKEFLAGASGENRVYSPLNVYLALGMLAELTEGESRGQIMELLGAQSMDELRTQASALWNANYCDDGAITSILGSSLWLNQGIDFKQKTLDTLAQVYYASSYQGEMAELNGELRSWLNAQTHGLLEQQVSDLELDPDALMVLATTVYFNAKWECGFDKARTAEDVFHAPSGDISCDFMNQRTEGTYWWGEHFSAVYRPFETGTGMYFILPDEGTDAEELLSDEELMAFLFDRDQWENCKHLMVNQSIPRFDVSSDIDLAGGLKHLGVVDVFDGVVSDFSNLTEDAEGIFVEKVTHAARVKADEEGVEAAAFTVIETESQSEHQEEEVDFVLNRPFLFVISGLDGAPLFVGIVNMPNG